MMKKIAVITGASSGMGRRFAETVTEWGQFDEVWAIAVCPFWTKTEFFGRAIEEGEPVVKKYIAMYEPDQIVMRAWRDAKRGKDVSRYGFKARGQSLLTKIVPHSLVMDIWMGQQDLK